MLKPIFSKSNLHIPLLCSWPRLKEFPSSLGKLRNLQVKLAAIGRLKVVDHNMQSPPMNPKLRFSVPRIDASKNQLQELPPDLTAWASLVDLQLAQNCLRKLPETGAETSTDGARKCWVQNQPNVTSKNIEKNLYSKKHIQLVLPLNLEVSKVSFVNYTWFVLLHSHLILGALNLIGLHPERIDGKNIEDQQLTIVRSKSMFNTFSKTCIKTNMNTH